MRGGGDPSKGSIGISLSEREWMRKEGRMTRTCTIPPTKPPASPDPYPLVISVNGLCVTSVTLSLWMGSRGPNRNEDDTTRESVCEGVGHGSNRNTSVERLI